MAQESVWLPHVTFKKVSYDGILGDNVSEYEKKHPETPFHEIIDIIRGKADQDYLDQIARHCFQDELDQSTKTVSTKDLENANPNFLRNRVGLQKN